MPRCWNAKSCLSSPSCLSKASQKRFPEAYCCHLPDPGRVLMESLFMDPTHWSYTGWYSSGGRLHKNYFTLCAAQPVIAVSSLMLWVAGWCPTNCCSSGLPDNIFRNPMQEKRAGRVRRSTPSSAKRNAVQMLHNHGATRDLLSSVETLQWHQP